MILAPQILRTVTLERCGGAAPLLRAPVNEPVLADIEIAGAGGAMPVVGSAYREILLKPVVVCKIEGGLSDRNHLLQHPALMIVERQQLAAAVVDDPGGRGKAELAGSPRHGDGIIGMPDARADHRIDSDVEFGIRRQPLEFLIQKLQTLLETSSGKTLLMLIWR